jgi:hypothetical protein
MDSNIEAKPSSPWRALLADPGPAGHIVQLYQDADFYTEAISHFAAEGLVRGESIIIVATAPNWKNISARLANKGFDITDLGQRGQLTLLDADTTLPKFLDSSMPDTKIFKDLAQATINKARGDGKFPRVRWWGEMVNVLYVNGNGRGSTRLEELFDEVAHQETIAIFCSFLMDKYDPKIYEGPFGDVCRTHSNVIPTENYTRHREAVDRAVAEIVGPVDTQLLESLISWSSNAGSGMPLSQEILLWVRDAMPQKFADVLSFARKFEESSARRSA